VPPALLDDLVRGAASEVLAARGLDPAALPADPGVGCPRDPAQGEYATSLALRAAGGLAVTPRELAGWLAAALVERPEVADARVAGPGFLNLWMTPAGRAAVVAEVLDPHRPVNDNAVPRETAGALRDALVRGVDPALLARRVPENPLFRLQYAHARTVALARNAADLGVDARPGPLAAPAEIALVRALAEVTTARPGEPQRLARHLEALADAVVALPGTCPVLPRGDEPVTDLHRARLAAVAAARRVLATGLGLLDLSAPDRI
jgi:arginyl-tRNA synthetase